MKREAEKCRCSKGVWCAFGGIGWSKGQHEGWCGGLGPRCTFLWLYQLWAAIVVGASHKRGGALVVTTEPTADLQGNAVSEQGWRQLGAKDMCERAEC